MRFLHPFDCLSSVQRLRGELMYAHTHIHTRLSPPLRMPIPLQMEITTRTIWLLVNICVIWFLSSLALCAWWLVFSWREKSFCCCDFSNGVFLVVAFALDKIFRLFYCLNMCVIVWACECVCVCVYFSFSMLTFSLLLVLLVNCCWYRWWWWWRHCHA